MGQFASTLGIPVDWSQISGARTIVESTLPDMNVELSQGSHFFHNLSSFRANYFMVQHDRPFPLAGVAEPAAAGERTELVRHERPRSGHGSRRRAHLARRSVGRQHERSDG